MNATLLLKRAQRLKSRYFTQGTPGLHTSPEWIEMRELIFRALEPFPEARIALAAALVDYEKRRGSEGRQGDTWH